MEAGVGNLVTENLVSGNLAMETGCRDLLEANPLRSRSLVCGLAVRECCAVGLRKLDLGDGARQMGACTTYY